MQKRAVRPEFGQDVGLIHEALVTGRHVGAGPGFWRLLADSPQLFSRCHRFLVNDGGVFLERKTKTPADIFYAAYDSASFGHDYGVMSRLVARVSGAGKSQEFWKSLAHDRLVCRHLVNYVRSQVMTATEAGHILRDNYFHALADVQRVTGKKYGPEDKSFLYTVPYTRETLERIRETHLLVPGIEMTIPEIAGMDLGVGLEGQGVEQFSTLLNPSVGEQRVRVRWHLIRKNVQPRSAGLTVRRQMKLLESGEAMPEMASLYFASRLFTNRTGRFLFDEVHARAWYEQSPKGGDLADNTAYLGKAFDADQYIIMCERGTPRDKLPEACDELGLGSEILP